MELVKIVLQLNASQKACFYIETVQQVLFVFIGHNSLCWAVKISPLSVYWILVFKKSKGHNSSCWCWVFSVTPNPVNAVYQRLSWLLLAAISKDIWCFDILLYNIWLHNQDQWGLRQTKYSWKETEIEDKGSCYYFTTISDHCRDRRSYTALVNLEAWGSWRILCSLF